MYELSRNRYKELKHFCLQYYELKEQIKILEKKVYSMKGEDPTGDLAQALADYKHAVMLIEMTAMNIGKFPGEKILKIVTEDRTVSEVCPNETEICVFYLRKFFWLLSEAKGV